MVVMRLRKLWQCVTVEPAMFSYFLAIYLLYSVFHPTVFNRVCTTQLSSNNMSNLDASMCPIIYSLNTSEATEAIASINKETNHWIKIASICSTLPSLFVDCLMGSWSDLFGRKMPMYLPSVGGLLATIVYVVVVCFEEVGVGWLCLASLLSGVFGGVTSVIGNSFAYVASMSERENRTLRCSVVESMMHLAATIGPFLSKFLKVSIGPLAVFIASGCFHLVNIFYCLMMKDPMSVEKKKKIRLASLFSFSHFIDSFKTVIAPRKGSARTSLFCLLIGLFIVQNLIVGELDILYPFLAHVGSANIFDYFFGLKSFFGALSLLLILPIAKWLGIGDYSLCFVGFTSFMCGLLVLGFSTTDLMVYMSAVIGFGSKLADAILRALISQVVTSEELGKVFGIIAVSGDLATITGALLFNSLHPVLSPYHSGAPYFLGSTLFLAPLALTSVSYYLTRSQKMSDSLEDQVHNNKGYQQEEE